MEVNEGLRALEAESQQARAASRPRKGGELGVAGLRKSGSGKLRNEIHNAVEALFHQGHLGLQIQGLVLPLDAVATRGAFLDEMWQAQVPAPQQ